MKSGNLMFIRKIIGIILTSILSIITIVNNICEDNFSNFKFFLIVLVLLIAVLSIYDIVICYKQKIKRYKLSVGSEKFYKFFSNWYTQNGSVSILCDDLDWIESTNNNKIFNSLSEKAKEKKLFLFLGEGVDSEIALRLKAVGAEVNHAPISLVSKYTFSCIAPMDRYSNIIIRDKNRDTEQNVEFVQISDNYLIDLINLVIREKMQNAK